jgi:peptidoglycan/xylan/chitin deacetylase (PgdA/CDA1 family)
MYRTPLERFDALCSALHVPGTLFAIGRDVCGIASARLAAFSAQGYEVGSYSYDHDVGLTEREPGALLHDVRRSVLTFQTELGITPVGYRAPGFRTSPGLRSELANQGFRYDCSTVMEGPLRHERVWRLPLSALRVSHIVFAPAAVRRWLRERLLRRTRAVLALRAVDFADPLPGPLRWRFPVTHVPWPTRLFILREFLAGVGPLVTCRQLLP